MRDELTRILERIADRRPRVLVCGDVILDEWWSGPSTALSREAPVPVVRAQARQCFPGGAGNTAVALAALGARVELCGVVGEDEAGRRLVGLLDQAGVGTAAILRQPGATTARKTRISSQGVILARVDEGTGGPPADSLGDELAERVSGILGDPQLSVLVCDYGLGAASAIRGALGRGPRPRLLAVDAHELAAWRELSPDLVTPNWQECCRLLADEPDGAQDRADLARARREELVDACGAAMVVLTLDRDGAVAMTRDQELHRTHARPAPDTDAVGAGDSFDAALVLALAVEAPVRAAVDFAQAAADVVTSRPGTATCDAESMRASAVLWDRRRIAARIARERAAGRRIVFTNGCFDILHRGHVGYLEQARGLGDLLVVGLNSDDSVRRLKGPGRPVNGFEDRAAMLTALASVDLVAGFEEDTPVALIEAIRPDVYVKGGDYAESMLGPEVSAVHDAGGQVRMVGYTAGHSTSAMIERMRRPGPRPIQRRTAGEWAATGARGLSGGQLDVLVPTCERPAELAVTLAGLAGQDRPGFRVVISDQSAQSPDWQHPAAAAMLRVLRAQGHPVVLDRNMPRRGMAQQRAHLLELSLRGAPEARQVLFLDDDVWLEPGQLEVMCQVLRDSGAGFVGEAVQGLSYLGDARPVQEEEFELWEGPVEPEEAGLGSQVERRWPLHNAANLAHLAVRLGLPPGAAATYRVAWVGGCVLYDRAVLVEAGGFGFWQDLPPDHSGEDVLAQWRVMAIRGGAGIVPSGAVHLESRTTVDERRVDARTLFERPGRGLPRTDRAELGRRADA